MPIEYKIERKKFEVIGDQLGAIIALEFRKQWEQFEVDECRGVEVFRERNRIIDANSEQSVINVQFAATQYEAKHQGASDGSNTYFIDFYRNEPSRDGKEGDEL